VGRPFESGWTRNLCAIQRVRRGLPGATSRIVGAWGLPVKGFDSAYLGVPPWDIGKPQGEIVQLEQERRLRGSVLDCGCGTGENALYLASRGHEAWGIDASPNAIRKAESKARDRGIAVKFLTADALGLGDLERTFDTVIDCGLFHVFSDHDRDRYVSSLASVMAPGAKLVLLCFSDLQAGDSGPRRISKTAILQAFDKGWSVLDIRAAALETNLGNDPVKAWLSEIVRGEGLPT
jgi:SAM-dependent methyltransferase